MASEEISGDVVRYTTKELLKEIRDELVGVRQDTRDRFHKLVGTIEGINLRLVSVEEDVRTLKKDRDHLVPVVDNLAKNIDIQGAVEAAFAEKEDRGFTKWEKLLGLGLTLTLVAFNIFSALYGL